MRATTKDRLHIAQRLPDRPHSSLRLLSLMLTPASSPARSPRWTSGHSPSHVAERLEPVPVRLNVTATVSGGTSLAESTVLAEPGPIAEPVQVSTTRRGLAPQYSVPVAGAGVLDWSRDASPMTPIPVPSPWSRCAPKDSTRLSRTTTRWHCGRWPTGETSSARPALCSSRSAAGRPSPQWTREINLPLYMSTCSCGVPSADGDVQHRAESTAAAIRSA